MEDDQASEEILPRQFGTRDCACHGEPMKWKTDTRLVAGGSWLCRVKLKNRDRERARRRRADGTQARYLANQILRGDQIEDYSNLHRGMAELKSQLGDPRPEGLELSLVNYWGPDSYWGWHAGVKRRHRLSNNPADYVWETHNENVARRASAVAGSAS